MVRGFATCLCDVLRLAAEVKKDVELSCYVHRGPWCHDLFHFLIILLWHHSLRSVVSRPCSCCDYCLSVRYTNMYNLVRGITIENCFYFIILHCLGSLAGIIRSKKRRSQLFSNGLAIRANGKPRKSPSANPASDLELPPQVARLPPHLRGGGWPNTVYQEPIWPVFVGIWPAPWVMGQMWGPGLGSMDFSGSWKGW